MTALEATPNPTRRPSVPWASAFLLLLALLQLALVPVLGGRDVELAPLFRADSLGLLFGTAWTLTLAAVSIRFARQVEGRIANLLLALFGVDLLAYAYAQNLVVLAVGLVLAGVCLRLILERTGASTRRSRVMFALLNPLIPLLLLLLITNFPAFVPPVGGVAAPWQPVAVLAAAVAVMLAAASGLVNAGDSTEKVPERADAPLVVMYSLASPYILAKMLVAAPWHPVGAWLLVLLGMFVVLVGVYEVCMSQGRRGAQPVTYTLLGVAVAGFGIAANSPLAAVGATWVMLGGVLSVATRDWKWAEILALIAVAPGMWMVSQGALETGYGVVAALLLPAYLLVVALALSGGQEASRGSRWPQVVAVALSLLAATLPQFAVETLLRPAARAMAGGVGALTTLEVDWGVGILVRTAQGAVQAALPTTGMAMAVFIAAVALYWLKQLAELATRRNDGDTQPQ